jgi:hypothetical protein
MKTLISILVTVNLIGLLAASWGWMPEMSAGKIAAWERAMGQAQASREKGDNFRALNSYLHASRIAASSDDWKRLLAVACGMEKVARLEDPTYHVRNVLKRAKLAAERKNSPEGLRTVTSAFRVLGQPSNPFELFRIQESCCENEAKVDQKLSSC